MIPYIEKYFDIGYTFLLSRCDAFAVGTIWICLLFLAVCFMTRKRYIPVCLWLFITVAVVVGTYRLGEFPVKHHDDERKYGKMMAEDTSEKPWLKMFYYANSVKSPYYNARPSIKDTMYCHIFFPCIKLLGDDYVSYRTVSVIFSALEVAVLFLLLKSMFGIQVAIFGSIFMVTAPWHLGIARTGLPYGSTNFYSLLLLALFWKATQNGLYYVPLAVFAGFSMTFYPTITVVYYFIPVYFVFIVVKAKGWKLKVGKVLWFLVFLGIVGKLFHEQGVLITDVFFYHRSSTYFQFGGIVNTINAIFGISFPVFFDFKSHNYVELYTKFNPIIVLLAIIGIGNAIRTIDKKQSVFILFLLVLAISIDAFSRENHMPRRTIMVLAPMMMLASTGLGVMLPSNKQLKYLIVVLVLGTVIVTNYIGYFTMYDNLLEGSAPYRKMQQKKLQLLQP